MTEPSEITQEDKLLAAVGYPIPLVALIMLFLEGKKNDPFIRYHAVQSLALTVAILIITFVLGCLLSILTFFLKGFSGTIVGLLWLVTLWPAFEAYQGKLIELPVIGTFIKKQGWVK